MKYFIGIVIWAIILFSLPDKESYWGLHCLMDSLLHLFLCAFIAHITKAELSLVADIASVMCLLMVLKVILGNPYVKDAQMVIGWIMIAIFSIRITYKYYKTLKR